MKVELQAPEQKKKMHRSQAVCIVLVICLIVAAVTAVITYYVSEYYRTNAELHSLQDKVRTRYTLCVNVLLGVVRIDLHGYIII